MVLLERLDPIPEQLRRLVDRNARAHQPSGACVAKDIRRHGVGRLGSLPGSMEAGLDHCDRLRSVYR